MKKDLVSVIIPTYNRSKKVIRLINSILDSSYSKLEIIVIDDASTDDTSEMLSKSFRNNEKVRVIRNDKNLYAAGSRNVGSRHAKGEFFFYIDDDNVLDQEAIGKLVEVFRIDKKIGELGLVNRSFKDKDIIYWLQTKRDMWTSRTYFPLHADDFFTEKYWSSDDVPNAYIIRSELVVKNGITFNPFYGIMYEESDVSYRIKKLGYTIKVVRDALIYHDVDDYMQHFVGDARMPYVFARNRIIFHSLYSNRIQFIGIISFWIWLFMFFYWYKVLEYKAGSVTSEEKFNLMNQYFKGTLAGLDLVLRHKNITN